MELSSAYLYEQLNLEYEITGAGEITEQVGFRRPFLLSADREAEGHVCIVPVEIEETVVISAKEEHVLYIFCGTRKKLLERFDRDYICVNIRSVQEIMNLYNYLQLIFDVAEDWQKQVVELIMKNQGIQKVVNLTSRFLGNPLMVMGLDFSLVAEAGMEELPERARLYGEDGINIDYMNALLQDEEYQKISEARSVVMFPEYLSGCRSLNVNLWSEGSPTHRVVLTEWKKPITQGDGCILKEFAGYVEYLLSHALLGDREDDLNTVFEKLLSDRTADYVRVSRRLTDLGWNDDHKYLCLIVRISYQELQNMSAKAICQHIRKLLPDSSSFPMGEEIISFFNLDKLGMNTDQVSKKLTLFIRDSFLKAGYSRSMEGHMNLRRQYLQARAALDVGGRKRPHLWIHYFDQIVMDYIFQESTRKLPGRMLCHENLLKLARYDEENQTEYMLTLRTYLEQNLSATQTANELFIHRSTFLYRLEKIKKILQSGLDEPEEIFYLNLSFRLLEWENK